MNQVIDLAITYKFLKNLVTPFEKWPAYKLGLIDKDGNIVKQRKDRLKQEEKDALGYFDVVTLNLRKLLGKLPGGKSAIATYAAAYLLLKEYPKKNLKEGYEPSEQQVALMLEEAIEEVEALVSPHTKDKAKADKKKYRETNKKETPNAKGFLNFVNQNIKKVEEEQAVTNSTAGIAGLKPDSIGVKKKAMIRYKKANQKLAPSRMGKRFVNFVAEEEKKPRVAKGLVYETDVYGAKAYHAGCSESGCGWQSKRYDKITQAQAAMKKHHENEHFKVNEGE